MATLRDVPAGGPELARLSAYDVTIHGGGVTGIREWKRECLEWLNANPGRTLPAGDILGVIRQAVRLISVDAGG
jgi:hypothetical protein